MRAEPRGTTPGLCKRIELAARRIGGGGIVEREDLAQEGWLAVLTHLRDRPEDEGDERLLATIAWRRMLSHLRYHRRRAARCGASPAMAAFSDEPRSADAALDVAEALEALDDRKRQYISAQIHDGRSLAEAAGDVGIAHATGQSWNHKIYNALRPLLQDGYGPDADRLRETRPKTRRDERRHRYAGVRRAHPTPRAFP